MMRLPFKSQNPPAEDEDIERLEKETEFEFPPVYLALLRYSNGGEWPINASPFNFVLFSIDELIQNLTATDFTEVYPHFLPIGGDGMSEYIALDFSGDDIKVVAIDALEEDTTQNTYLVAETFDDFLRMIGKEVEE